MTEFFDTPQIKILEKCSTAKKNSQKIFFKWIFFPVIPLSVVSYIVLHENLLAISGINHFYLEMVSVVLAVIVGYVGISRAIVLHDRFSLFVGLALLAGAMNYLVNGFFEVYFFLEVWISLSFLLTTLLYCYKKQFHLINDNFYKGLILFLVIQIFVNLIIFNSTSEFDTAFSIAHILKIVSFFVFILAICSSLSQKHKIQLNLTSDLLKAYKKLEEKIRIEEKFKKLREVEKLKDEFSAMVTHELRTPLTPILAHIDYLKNPKQSDKLSENQLAAINSIESNAQRLDKLVTDILTLHKLNMQKIKFVKSSFDVKLLMEEITKDFELFTKQKQIKFVNNTPESFPLISDKERIRQVFDNLITNAAEFVSPQSGMIEIGAFKKDNDAVFYVKDNGIGIAKEKQNNLFKKFYQVNTSIRRKHGGTGLGLVICKGITKGLGGKIWVDSEEGKGTTFFFSIPTYHEMMPDANLPELNQEIKVNSNKKL